MARIPKSYFGQPRDLPFDVFIRLGVDHFLQVARTGVPSQIHLLRAFDSDLVPWFYVHQGDFPRYLDEQVRLAEGCDFKTDEIEKTLPVIQSATKAIIEMIRTSGMTPVAWGSCVRLVDCLQHMVASQPAVSRLLDALVKLDTQMAKHSIFVSLIALSIARETGFFSEQEVRWLATAGLLHDIGYLRLPEDMIGLPIDRMNEVQRQIYQRHPQEGALILRDCSQVPSEVVEMVRDHHEDMRGTGFPRGVGAENIHFRCLCLALAERFGDLTIGDGFHPDHLSLSAAVNSIASNDGDAYPIEMIKALGLMIQPIA